MNKLTIAVIALLGAMNSAQAHQIWIEQADGQTAVVRFGEFGDNLREASPGLLDKFSKVTATLLSPKGEQSAEAGKTATGFTLPFAAKPGDGIVAQDANYPLYTFKQQDKENRNWFFPAARLITGFAAQPPKLVLDLVPTGKDGQFKLVFKDQPKPKTKVTLVTQSGWAKEAHTDAQGLVSFEMPWQGVYVAEVSFTDRTPGERAGASGAEKYDAVVYGTTLTYLKADGLAPIPAGPAAAPTPPK
ncbi:MAG: cobalt ABC transporter substrate-binding protein [Rhodopseudomonas palustris]|uniref:Cobalt ABC transporter substrate-binding protein n=1 Tax=Rhodopseudomonas palustris TaxID=1076 RepID=A0A933RXF3_RHOPL|nr:cobalt ABC transporter substrate-binding protein [Rhodopseudomonas palustris]